MWRGWECGAAPPVERVRGDRGGLGRCPSNSPRLGQALASLASHLLNWLRPWSHFIRYGCLGQYLLENVEKMHTLRKIWFSVDKLLRVFVTNLLDFFWGGMLDFFPP